MTRNFSPSNVGSLDLTQRLTYFTTDWFGDDTFKDDFLTAWGVKQS